MYNPKISNDDMTIIRESVIQAAILAEEHAQTFSEDGQIWVYGKELRNRLLDILKQRFTTVDCSRKSYALKIIVNEGFSFFVTASQDYYRSAGYKAYEFQPDLFEEIEGDALDMMAPGYELVLDYDKCHFSSATFMPHMANCAIVPICDSTDLHSHEAPVEQYQEKANDTFKTKIAIGIEAVSNE